MSDINSFWQKGQDPYNPHNLPKISIPHRFPLKVWDSTGHPWEMTMDYFNHKPDEPEKATLVVTYKSDDHLAVAKYIVHKDWGNLADYDQMKALMEVIGHDIELNRNRRKEAEANPVTVDKPKLGNR